jgi:hypothetical protein
VGPALLLMEKFFFNQTITSCFARFFEKKIMKLARENKFEKKVSTSLNFYCVSGLPLKVLSHENF